MAPDRPVKKSAITSASVEISSTAEEIVHIDDTTIQDKFGSSI